MSQADRIGEDLARYGFGCGCEWDGGDWTVCVAHRTPHSQHRTYSPACAECRELPSLEDCATESPVIWDYPL